MFAFLLPVLLLAQDAPPQTPGDGDEIVVVGRRQGCQAYLRGEAMSERRLEAYARDWRQGVPVRVRAPSRADYRCLAKIAFKLGKKGVRLIEFVGPSDLRRS